MTASKIATDTRHSGTPLSRAQDAIPLRPEILAGLAEVAERLRQARAGGHPEREVIDAAVSAVVAGSALPALGERVIRIRTSNETAEAELAALIGVEQRLRERLRDLAEIHADDALDVLRAELDDVLTRARPVVEDLGDVDSAEEAITADKVSAWRLANTLAKRHGEIRAAQAVLVAGAVEPPDVPQITERASAAVRRLVADHGIVRDPDEHGTLGEPDYREASTNGANRDTSGRVVGSTGPPTGHRPWTTGSDLGDLRYVVRADVEPWLPRVAELTRARDEHRKRTEVAARAEAERLPGDEPERRLPHGRRMPPPPAALVQRLAEEELGIRDPL